MMKVILLIVRMKEEKWVTERTEDSRTRKGKIVNKKNERDRSVNMEVSGLKAF